MSKVNKVILTTKVSCTGGSLCVIIPSIQAKILGIYEGAIVTAEVVKDE